MRGLIPATKNLRGVNENTSIVNDSMKAEINTITEASTMLHLNIIMTMITNRAILNTTPAISKPVAGIMKPRNAENTAKTSKVPPSARYLIPDIVK